MGTVILRVASQSHLRMDTVVMRGTTRALVSLSVDLWVGPVHRGDAHAGAGDLRVVTVIQSYTPRVGLSTYHYD